MCDMMSYFKDSINKCTGSETPEYRESLLNEIMHHCEVLRGKKLKVPDRLGSWIDFLNGN